jgi:S1-C subfamily serine protease
VDIAVLRVVASESATPLPPRDFLALPRERHTQQQLLGAPVALIHGSIAWSAGTDAQQVARDDGRIITSSETFLRYSVASYKGHSGAALLFRSGQVIGLHSEGFNDLEQRHSETSPATSADAVRLDAREIWEAVDAAKVSPAAAAGTGVPAESRRRRMSTRT